MFEIWDTIVDTVAVNLFFQAVTNVVTMLINQVKVILEMFTSKPILFIPFCIFIIGAAIGLTKRTAHI